MAGFFEELVAELKIVPSPENLDNINSHIQQIQALVSSIGGQFANLNLGPAVDNIRQFAQGLESAKQSMAGVATEMMGVTPEVARKEIDQWKNGLAYVVKQHAEIQKHQQDMSISAQNVTNQYWVWKDITGRVFGLMRSITNYLHSWADASLDIWQNHQHLENSLTAVMQEYAEAVNTVGSHSQSLWGDAISNMDKARLLAQDFLSSVQEIQKNSWFGVQALGEAGQSLLANMGSIPQSIEMLNHLQRLALGTPERLTGMVTAMNNITRATKITAMNLRQFSTASGMNLNRAIHNIVGGTEAQFNKALRKGLIPKEVVYQAIRDLSIQLGSAPEEIAKQWDARWANMKEQLGMKLGQALEPILNAVVPIMNKLAELDFTQITQALILFSESVAEAAPLIGDLVDILYQLLKLMVGVIAGLTWLLAKISQAIQTVPYLSNVIKILISLLGMRGLWFVLNIITLKFIQIIRQLYMISNAALATGGAMIDMGRATSAGARTAVLGINMVTAATTRLGKAVSAVKKIMRAFLPFLAIEAGMWIWDQVAGPSDDEKKMDELEEELKQMEKEMRKQEAQAAAEEKREIKQNNTFNFEYMIDDRGKTKFSKEMLDEMVRSVFNMELIKIVEVSDNKGTISPINIGG